MLTLDCLIVLCISLCRATASATIRSQQRWRGSSRTGAFCENTVGAARRSVGRRSPWLRPPPPDLLLAQRHSGAEGQRHRGIFSLPAGLYLRCPSSATVWCIIWQRRVLIPINVTNSCNCFHASGTTTYSWLENWLTTDTWARRKLFPTGRSWPTWPCQRLVLPANRFFFIFFIVWWSWLHSSLHLQELIENFQLQSQALKPFSPAADSLSRMDLLHVSPRTLEGATWQLHHRLLYDFF